MRVEIVEGLFLGKVFPVLEIGIGEHEGQYFLQVCGDGVDDYPEKKGSWFDAARCRFVSEAGYKQLIVDDVIEELEQQQPTARKITRDEALAALETVGKITRVERLQYCYEKDLLEVSRCNAITEMLMEFMQLGEPKVKRARGQRGKGKKEAAISVSLRIPPDILRKIDTEAAFKGVDRTALILSKFEVQQ
ncbi:hypothetical protein MTYP_03245 [Methylophilaceae bacterium]|nr:hypothetical protein MTYP_03245 [Methylophilaceae bacterium]